MHLIIGPSLEAIGGISTFLNDFLKYVGDENKIKYVDTYLIKKRKNQHKSSFIDMSEVFGGIKVLLYLYKILKIEENISTVVINTSSYWGFWEKNLLILMSKYFKKRTILIIHGGDFMNFYKNSPLKMVIIFFLKTPNKTIFVSKEMKVFFSEIAKKKFTHLLLPISNPIKQRDTMGETDLLYNNFQYKLFTINVLEKRKRVVDIIESFLCLFKNSKNTCLVIAGDGEEKNKILKKIEECENIFYIGAVRGKEKENLFNECNICINFSQNESFGIVIIEALLSKKLLITTPVGIASEIIIDKENGFIVNEKKQLIRVLKDAVEVIDNQEKYKQFIKSGLKASGRFTWKVVGEDWKKELSIK